MHTPKFYTQDLRLGDRVRLKPYPDIINHVSDCWGKRIQYSWIKAIAGKIYTIDRIEDDYIRLVGHPCGPFWVKESAVKEKVI